ncbi:hypothetical protein EBI01_11690 [Marinomonas rhizomae]|uniref:Uncharacterized protein n=1 Tax=Marinomonas rhizomae TaxID=491948 RepID=A0A366J8C2_9GAMM|nr:hypothetical protein [Marinomonas rhizomae]RBP83192.1 hypothetical protein DFP80_107170 [Marinomonas rhizomae]RNF72512.1 hypothetical protein EBI01_11690 [Marinomonas rhizomae]
MTPENQEIFIEALNFIVLSSTVQGMLIGMFVGFAVQINVHLLCEFMTDLFEKITARKVS